MSSNHLEPSSSTDATMDDPAPLVPLPWPRSLVWWPAENTWDEDWPTVEVNHVFFLAEVLRVRPLYGSPPAFVPTKSLVDDLVNAGLGPLDSSQIYSWTDTMESKLVGVFCAIRTREILYQRLSHNPTTDIEKVLTVSSQLSDQIFQLHVEWDILMVAALAENNAESEKRRLEQVAAGWLELRHFRYLSTDVLAERLG